MLILFSFLKSNGGYCCEKTVLAVHSSFKIKNIPLKFFCGGKFITNKHRRNIQAIYIYATMLLYVLMNVYMQY